MSKVTRWCRVAAASCVALAAIGLTSGAEAQQKLKVYVSTGFDGNTWMNASTNLLAGNRADEGLQGSGDSRSSISAR